jgi:hypothetical protein
VNLETLQNRKDYEANFEEYSSTDTEKGIKWAGGELAFHLNDDTKLENLLRDFVLYRLSFNTDIRVKPNKKQNQVEIIAYVDDYSYFTKECLEAFNIIAEHVRKVETISTGRVIDEKRQVRVIRGSIIKSAINSTKWGAIFGLGFGVIYIIFSAVRNELDSFTFIMVGIIILFFILFMGFGDFIRLGVKRLRGRF